MATKQEPRVELRLESNMDRFEEILLQLGLSAREFEMETAKFDLSPKEWFEKKLAAKGWVKAGPPAQPVKCEKACCQTA